MTDSIGGSKETGFELDRALELGQGSPFIGVIIPKLVELTKAGLLFWRMLDPWDNSRITYIATVKQFSFVLDVDGHTIFIKRPLQEPARGVPSRDEVIGCYIIPEIRSGSLKDFADIVMESYESYCLKELQSLIGVLDNIQSVKP